MTNSECLSNGGRLTWDYSQRTLPQGKKIPIAYPFFQMSIFFSTPSSLLSPFLVLQRFLCLKSLLVHREVSPKPLSSSLVSWIFFAGCFNQQHLIFSCFLHLNQWRLNPSLFTTHKCPAISWHANLRRLILLFYKPKYGCTVKSKQWYPLANCSQLCVLDHSIPLINL